MKGKNIAFTIVGIALFVLGLMYLKFNLPIISVSAEALPHLSIGSMPITNSLLTSWTVTIVLIVIAYLATRNMKMVPSGGQNALEMLIEGLYGVVDGLADKKWVASFFVVPATIFFYVFASNMFGLIPGLAGIGFCEEHHATEAGAEAAEHISAIIGCQPNEVLVPIFRSPSADLNNTLMLALVTQIVAQFFGLSALGFGGYMGKFFVFDGIKKAFGPDDEGNKRDGKGVLGQLAFGVIEMLVGLLEFLSEFTKVIAYTFRLFGNIFAGEVMIIVLTFLIPVFLSPIFMGLEVFVGMVQAFVFFILSVAFYQLAITPHGDHAEEGAH